MIKNYLFDLAKIVEAAASSDSRRMSVHANQICDRLELDGELESATRLRRLISGADAKQCALSKASGGKSSSKTTPIDAESGIATADEEFFETGSIGLFLEPAAQYSVDQFLTYIHASARLAASGVGVSPTLLTYGPPGCGKTQLAKYIAAELGVPLITARIDGVISSYLGSTAKNLRRLFDYATSKPCVLFLDEFDALAKMRDDAGELGELKRVVISLLQNIDALDDGHVLLAATNHEHLLDPAIWRRFACKIRLNLPGPEARRSMLASHLDKYNTRELLDVMTALTNGMNGAQLRHLAADCIRKSIINDCEFIDPASAVEISLSNNANIGIDSQDSMPELIRTLRTLDPKTFTQSRIANLLGVTQSHVSKTLRKEKK